MAGPLLARRAYVTARRAAPVVIALYRRWESLPPERKAHYRRVASERAGRARRVAAEAPGRARRVADDALTRLNRRR